MSLGVRRHILLNECRGLRLHQCHLAWLLAPKTWLLIHKVFSVGGNSMFLSRRGVTMGATIGFSTILVTGLLEEEDEQLKINLEQGSWLSEFLQHCH